MRRVLVVDDDANIQELTILALNVLAGWTVFAAYSGEEGLKVAQAHPIDVILLDVMMPGMDGPATLNRLKESPLTRNIPVIFLTASKQDQRQNRDVIACLAKPFDPKTLASRVAAAMGWK